MINFLKIIILSCLLINNTNLYAVELIDTIKNESKSVLKTLTRKSLKKDEIKLFLSKYVILIDDKKGDGLVTYYFDDIFYRRYKDLNLISEDNWGFSKLGHLKILIDNNKETWKIQLKEPSTINIKKKFNSVGILYEFSYLDKINFYINLEEKKLNLVK